MTITRINRRIEGTDIYVFNRETRTNLFTYSRPISLEEDCGRDRLPEGLNIWNAIRVNRFLMEKSNGKVSLPTIEEYILLEEAGLLGVNGTSLIGLSLHRGSECYHEHAAKKFRKTVRERGYSLPVLASFKSLNLNQKTKKSLFHYGCQHPSEIVIKAAPSIVSEEGLITGEDARKILRKFSHYGPGLKGMIIDNSFGGYRADLSDSLNINYERGELKRITALGNGTDIMKLVRVQGEKSTAKVMELEEQARRLEEEAKHMDELTKSSIETARSILLWSK